MKVYLDDSQLSLRLRAKLTELGVPFELYLEGNEPVIYVGRSINIPSGIKICKMVLEIEDLKELDFQIAMNTLCYSGNISESDVHILAKRMVHFYTESTDILDQYSVMVHDIFGDINHVSCYAQLCLMDSEDQDVIDNCTVVVDAASKLEKKVEDLRMRSLGFVLSKEYQKSYNI